MNIRPLLALSLGLVVATACHRTAPTPTAQPANTPSIRWIEDDFRAAFAAAQSAQKPLLVEFSAPWCVYCALAEATVLHQSAVVALAEKFIPLRINIDVAATRDFANQYQVTGIPVFLTLAPDGTEFSRISDPTTASLTGLMAAALATHTTEPAIKSFYQGLKAEQLDQTAEATTAYTAAHAYFAAHPGWELATILNFRAQQPDTASAAAKEFLTAFPRHPGRPAAWYTLAQKVESDASKDVCRHQALQEVARYLTPDYVQTSTEHELGHLQLQATLRAELGLVTKEESWRAIASVATARAHTLATPLLSKPYWIRAISWNIKGGDWHTAVALAEPLVVQYSKETTFYEYLSWAYMTGKQYKQAAKILRQAVAIAGDSNRLSLILDLADALRLMGDRDGAVALLDDTLRAEQTTAAPATERQKKRLKKMTQRLTEWKMLDEIPRAD